MSKVKMMACRISLMTTGNPLPSVRLAIHTTPTKTRTTSDLVDTTHELETGDQVSLPLTTMRMSNQPTTPATRPEAVTSRRSNPQPARKYLLPLQAEPSTMGPPTAPDVWPDVPPPAPLRKKTTTSTTPPPALLQMRTVRSTKRRTRRPTSNLNPNSLSQKRRKRETASRTPSDNDSGSTMQFRRHSRRCGSRHQSLLAVGGLECEWC